MGIDFAETVTLVVETGLAASLPCVVGGAKRPASVTFGTSETIDGWTVASED